MGYIKEPKGVDFIVGPSTLTAKDKKMISDIIAKYKRTGKKPHSVKPLVARKRTVKNVQQRNLLPK
jgi:hypothetical protein